MGCNNSRCLLIVKMDLHKMAVRFGPDQSYLKADLERVYRFRCKRCGSYDWALALVPGSCVRMEARAVAEQAEKKKPASQTKKTGD